MYYVHSGGHGWINRQVDEYTYVDLKYATCFSVSTGSAASRGRAIYNLMNMKGEKLYQKARTTAPLMRDRISRLRSYTKCFTGREFVSWLVDQKEVGNSDEALILGQHLLENGIIHHGEFFFFFFSSSSSFSSFFFFLFLPFFLLLHILSFSATIAHTQFTQTAQIDLDAHSNCVTAVKGNSVWPNRVGM